MHGGVRWPDSQGGVRLDKAALYLGRNGRCMFLSTEGVLHFFIDSNDATWNGHLELQIGIMRDRIEAVKSGSSEQCVIAVAKWDDVED